jgi:hypothetical protein
MRIALRIVATLGIALTCLLLLLEWGDRGGSAGRVEPTAEEPTALTAIDVADPQPRAVVRTDVQVLATSPRTPTRLFGTYVVVDVYGKPKLHPTESGSLQLRYRIDDEWHEKQVAVRDGRWSVSLPGCPAEVDQISARLGGWPIAGFESQYAPDDAETGEWNLAFQGKRLHAVTVKVIDAASKAPSNGVRVIYDGSEIARGNSPVQVHPAPGDLSGSYTIRADGHAWRDVRLAHQFPSTTSIVALGPAAALNLTITSDRRIPAGEAIVIRSAISPLDSRRVEYSTTRVIPCTVGHHRIEGLPPVETMVQLRGSVTGSDTVTLAQHRVSSLTIHAASTPPSPLTRLRGTIHIPSSWRMQDATLQRSHIFRFDQRRIYTR